jgi:uncharacterized protein
MTGTHHTPPPVPAPFGATERFPAEWCIDPSPHAAGRQPATPETEPGRGWVEHLSPEQCWERLARSAIGRVGVLVDSAPEVYPVTFIVDGRSVVFRTGAGTKLRGIDRSPSVCLEVDGVDEAGQTGWSVLVKGRAAEVGDAEDLLELRALPLRSWAAGTKEHWIRIRPSEVTGRCIHGSGWATTPAAADGGR